MQQEVWKISKDAIKANKFATTNKRRLRKGTMINEKNIEVVEVSEGDEFDTDIVVATDKKRKEVK